MSSPTLAPVAVSVAALIERFEYNIVEGPASSPPWGNCQRSAAAQQLREIGPSAFSEIASHLLVIPHRERFGDYDSRNDLCAAWKCLIRAMAKEAQISSWPPENAGILQWSDWLRRQAA